MNDLFTNLRETLTGSISNEHILTFLNKALNQGQLASSYIFSGENSSSEKYLIAKELNKILNCERNLALINDITNQSHGTIPALDLHIRQQSPSVNENKNNKLNHPCSSCQNCKWLTEDKHPKTPLLISLERGKNIKIEDIKKLQDTLSQSSHFFRIIIIDPADYEYLNKHSANALLKSIEEPHPRTLYLLFASSSKSVLGTLKSRSQGLQIFPELSLNFPPSEQSLDAGLHDISSDSVLVNEILNTNEKSLHSIFKKYYDDNSLNTKTKNLLFSEEIKKFKREDVLEFCEELENKFQKELEERVLLNTDRQADQENASLKNLKDCISLIQKLESAQQELNSYINTQAVIQRIGLF